MHPSIRRSERTRREGGDHREGTQVKVTKYGVILLAAAGPRGALRRRGGGGGRGRLVRPAVVCMTTEPEEAAAWRNEALHCLV